jgi:hypothetical protein
VYALIPGEADTEAEEAKVVRSIILHFGSNACALFDSFISTTYVGLCSINTEPLGCNLWDGSATETLC